MSTQQPAANTMSVEAAKPETEQQQQRQTEGMRLRGGGNACADCIA